MMLLAMIFMHIIDDFCLQIPSLSKLKQREWWVSHDKFKEMYRYDYIVGLLIHGLSWSIMVHIPLYWLVSDFWNSTTIITSIIINAMIHAVIDDFKANRGWLNLIQDQLLHLVQIICIFVLFI